MKTIKKHFLTKPLASFLAFLILFVSCSTPDGNIILEGNNDFQNMSSEQVFRNVLFKEGNLGKQLYNQDDIEMMNSLDSELIKQLEKTKNEIIDGINKNNPDYFENFKSNILSNNHNIVLNTLLEARSIIKKTVKEQNNLTDKDLNNYTRTDLKNELKKQKVYSEKVACVAVVVVVLVLVLFVLLIPVKALENNEISRLENEQIVSKIIAINQ